MEQDKVSSRIGCDREELWQGEYPAGQARPLPDASSQVPRPSRGATRDLRLRRCRDCGQHIFDTPAICPFCLSENLERPAAGRTRVDTPPKATYDGSTPDIALLLGFEPLLGPDTN